MLSRGTCIAYLWKILRQIFRFCIFTRIYIFKILYHEVMSNKKPNVAIVSTAPTSQSGINVDEEITNRGWASSSSR